MALLSDASDAALNCIGFNGNTSGGIIEEEYLNADIDDLIDNVEEASISEADHSYPDLPIKYLKAIGNKSEIVDLKVVSKSSSKAIARPISSKKDPLIRETAIITTALILGFFAQLCTPFHHPFLYHNTHLTTSEIRDSRGGRVCLSAAAKRSGSSKTPKGQKSAGGGFGLSPKKRTDVEGKKPTLPIGTKESASEATLSDARQKDYAIFPPLEPHVQATLIPAQSHMAAGTLPLEMYDRLDQIYGFPNFNYETVDSASISHTDNKNDFLSDANNVKDDDEEGTKQELLYSLAKIPAFQNFRVLHVDPMVLVIYDFFTMEECDRCISISSSSSGGNASESFRTRSKTVGNDSVSKAQRTSTTWFHHYSAMPELLTKATRLLGLDSIRQWEEPQTVRYRKSEHFTWHLDALAPSPTLQSFGGQRIATLLVYLTEMSKDEDGGGTVFRDLGPLKFRPKKGSALLFFPAAGGIPGAPFDIRTVHAGEAVAESSAVEKWIAQLWLREGIYTPSAPIGNVHNVDSIHQFCSESEQTRRFISDKNKKKET